MSLTRREFLSGLSALGIGGLAAASLTSCGSKKRRPLADAPNVLLIAVDDLRPELGCYGHPLVKSPHIDSLARSGIVFERAYCQEALCAPSRASLLTGKRPDTTGIYGMKKNIRETIPDTITLQQRFKEYGYYSVGMGKVFHNGQEDAASYSVPHQYAKGVPYALPENVEIWKTVSTDQMKLLSQGTAISTLGVPATENADVADNVYMDGQLTKMAEDVLEWRTPQALAQSGEPWRPFFLSVGFLKPHLPFCAPKKYWDLYDRNQIPLPHPDYPLNVPEFAKTNWHELRLFSDIPDVGVCDAAQTRELIHGYYACVSYIDAQVGRLLKTLDELDLRKNTVIALFGDHGWKLGEYSAWSKQTNFELDLRSPLIISAPGEPGNVRTKALTEFVDIYPTLCDLCGIPAPSDLEGLSMTPLFADPGRTWKKAAFSQYPRGENAMGYSMRTEFYRFTEWRRLDNNKVIGMELYDLKNDFLGKENLAVRPEYASLVNKMKEQLARGWRHAMPTW